MLKNRVSLCILSAFYHLGIEVIETLWIYFFRNNWVLTIWSYGFCNVWRILGFFIDDRFGLAILVIFILKVFDVLNILFCQLLIINLKCTLLVVLQILFSSFRISSYLFWRFIIFWFLLIRFFRLKVFNFFHKHYGFVHVYFNSSWSPLLLFLRV